MAQENLEKTETEKVSASSPEKINLVGKHHNRFS